MPETGQAAGMVYLGGDYYGDPGSQRTYDVRTKTYSTNYDWLVAELKREGKYVGTGQQLTPQQQAAQQEAQRRLAAEDYAREQQLRRGRFTARPTEPGAPIGVEAAKQAEQAAYREKVSIGQSMQQTTREEAGVIQRMLKSPTAQFGSQAAAQRGYELAARYDRSFAPSQVRATLAPQYAPQAPQQAPARYFYPAPTEQAGIRPSFPTPAQKGSIAEMAGYRSRLSLYKPAMRSLALSESLQRGFESSIGYNEQASAPTKFISGMGSVVTSLPAFVGTGLLGYEALAKFPKKTIKETPKSALSIGSQFVSQAKTKPIETAGQLTGMYLGGKALSKVPSIKTPTYRQMFGKSRQTRIRELKTSLISETAIKPIGISQPIQKPIPITQKMFGLSKETRARELKTSLLAETEIRPLEPTYSVPTPQRTTYQKMFGLSKEALKQEVKARESVGFIPGLGGYHVEVPIYTPESMTSIKTAIVRELKTRTIPETVGYQSYAKAGSIASAYYRSKGYTPELIKSSPDRMEEFENIRRSLMKPEHKTDKLIKTPIGYNQDKPIPQLQTQPKTQRISKRIVRIEGPQTSIKKSVVIKGMEKGIMTQSEFMAAQEKGLSIPIAQRAPLSRMSLSPMMTESEFYALRMNKIKPYEPPRQIKKQLKIQYEQKNKLIPGYLMQSWQKATIIPDTTDFSKSKINIGLQSEANIRMKNVSDTNIQSISKTNVLSKVHAQIKTQTKTATHTRTNQITRGITRVTTPSERPPKIREPQLKIPEYQVSPMFRKKRKASRIRTRKFKKVLGGKTFEQLSAELTRKITSRKASKRRSRK